MSERERKLVRRLGAVVGLVVTVVSQAAAQEIFIWDNDNGKVFRDPETGNYVGCQYGIQQALTANGLVHATATSLPPDLSVYDVIFIVLGWC